MLADLRLRSIPLTLAAIALGALLPNGAVADTSPDRGLVNYETPHVHPLDLTPDHTRLLAVNTALHALEVFDVTGAVPIPVATIPVGLDPVSVRARTNGEAWVVNHISDSVSVVDLQQETVVATVETDNEPADVVFAAGRAFVSCSEANNLNVFDLGNLTATPQRVPIQGEDPRALAVSADGGTVYVAVFESGNGTTVVSRLRTERPESPYGGQLPVPNLGSEINPPINPELGQIPSTALIVRKNDQGQWLDDNGGDWSVFISGRMSLRASGWDLIDRDLALVDTQTLTATYQGDLMNIVMALDVHPVTGAVSVVGTEAFNEIRFEPNLKGKFLRVNMATFGAGGALHVRDLNPQLDYAVASVAAGVRAQSIGDPRGIAWNAEGDLAWITGMGSNNVVVVDPAGNRVARVGVGQGPTGVVLDDAAGRGYVLNKFSGSISVLDLVGLEQTGEVPFFDPTPESIRAGRPLLYDTHASSGLGHVACASCHVDARTDRLAWDLGDPSGQEVTVPTAGSDGELTGATIVLSPMKGALMTQTLQDIMSMGALHWRGDRDGLSEFGTAFNSLMGAGHEVPALELQALGNFLDTIHLPPNPYRNLDNSRPASITLPDGATVTTSNFNALRGDNNNANDCLGCHMNGRPRNVFVNRELGQAFIPPALAGLYDRLGYWPELVDGSTSGFGFFHDGVGSLRFASRVTSSETQDDMLAEIMTLEGPGGPLVGNESRQDTHAGVGRQLTLAGAPTAAQSDLLNQLLTISDTSPHASLIARGRIGGRQRGFYHLGGSSFQSDHAGETFQLADLIETDAATADGSVALPETLDPLTFTLVAAGTEVRLGVDLDFDSVFDADDCAPLAPGVQEPPGKIGVTLEVDKEGPLTRISWIPGTNGHTSNVYRGTLGRPWAYDESCVAPEITADFHEDATTPALGTGLYYLVSSRNACGDSRAGPAPGGGDHFPPEVCPALGRDSDADRVLDVADNCTEVPNADQIDTDANGTGDACELQRLTERQLLP